MIFENMDKIVFAGDSVTDMGSAQPVGDQMFDNLGQSYVRRIDNLLGSVYPERYIRVINSGISGNTSRDLLARWERDVLRFDPQWVSICIGINDVWRQFDIPTAPEYACTPEEYRANMTAMLDSLRGRVKGAFLMTPWYMEPNKTDFMRARMEEYVNICRELAGQYDFVTLVDVQALFDRYFTVRHSAYIAWDRVHPNQVGATLIAREFLSHCGFDYEHKF